MFYTARTTSGHRGHYCLSIATATSRASVHRSSNAPILCRDDEGGAIDPDPFIDGSGHPWLYFKTYDDINTGSMPSRIYAVPLSSDGQHLAGTPRIVLAQEHLSSLYETVENPQMIRGRPGTCSCSHAASTPRTRTDRGMRPVMVRRARAARLRRRW